MDLTPSLKPNKLLTPFQIVVGGPWYDVELGRLDGLSSTAASVEGMLPQPTDDVNKLTSHFAKNGLSLDDIINATYLPQLKDLCPKDVDPRKEIFMDPITPGKFDNVYYQNLQQGRGLFKSDQALFTDPRSKPTVNLWASNGQLYNQAFVNSMIKLGRVGTLFPWESSPSSNSLIATELVFTAVYNIEPCELFSINDVFHIWLHIFCPE
ncbi:unnamed protein product [Brassica napus]|uniref:peroxidase n=1 Tax=Brassica napus TaxID=3708 RepID=A0A816QWU2_BRANA|nr:unnamed protein product [Brassica napus]